MPSNPRNHARIFWGCFIAIATCAFGFVVRTQVIDAWQVQFNLSETEKGEILGVGFWPFAFSILGFGLVIDKIGYGRAVGIGFVFHVASVMTLLLADSARMLYWGTFIFALSNGTVEGYMNTAIASMYPKAKTKWISLVAAGWPCGVVLGGLLAIGLGAIDWRWKVGLTLAPTLVYGLLFLGARFPISERVAAGVRYRDMLKDVGAVGSFVVIYLVGLQVCDGILQIEAGKFIWPLLPAALAALIVGGCARSLGQPLYLILLFIMIPLATTELGIDSWITDLMAPEMRHIGLNAGWVLVYTAAVMTLPRFSAGPLVRWLTPPGLLACGTLAAALGISTLSTAVGVAIITGATLYGLGKSVFWGTMMGMVSEQFPRGGALALNGMGGVGLLGLSVGMVFLGNVQDRSIEKELAAHDASAGTTLHTTYLTRHKTSIFGGYAALNQDSLKRAPPSDRRLIEQAQGLAKKGALKAAVALPLTAFAAFLIMIAAFKLRGGYRIAELSHGATAEVKGVDPNP